MPLFSRGTSFCCAPWSKQSGPSSRRCLNIKNRRVGKVIDQFEALMINAENGKPKASFRTISLADLPDNDVLVRVHYSSLNYKDGLAVSGKARIARRMPMVAGIDLAGEVVESMSPQWKAGDKVILNGGGLSETEWGAYTRFQRVKPDWLIRLPEAFDARQAMAIGTAGYTAALCVDALERSGVLEAGRGRVLVTGAAGGVGSVAISLLASKGHEVTASTGRVSEEAYLRSIGATDVVDRTVLASLGKPLQQECWAAAVDSIGSATLANVLAQTCYGGAVAACGLAGGSDLPASVLPHILRAVTLIGVDSVFAPLGKRQSAWAMLAEHLDPRKLSEITREEPLRRVPELAEDIIAGRIRGRVVIALD